MKFIIIGAGRMGSGLTQLLHKLGHDITLIDKDEKAFERLSPLVEARRMIGVGFDKEVLKEAGIEHVDGVAALTPSDEANVVIARVAREVFRVPKVVARLYDPRKAEIYRKLGLEVVAPVAWAIDRVADSLCFSATDPVFSIESGQANIQKVEVSHLMIGKTVGEITVPSEVVIIALTRTGKVLLPTGSTLLQEKDILHILVHASASARFEQMIALA